MYFSRHFLSSVNFHKGEIDDQFKETQSKVFISQESGVGKLRPRRVLAAEGGRGSWEKELLPGLWKHRFGAQRKRISGLLLPCQVTMGKECQSPGPPSVSPSVKWG